MDEANIMHVCKLGIGLKWSNGKGGIISFESVEDLGHYGSVDTRDCLPCLEDLGEDSLLIPLSIRPRPLDLDELHQLAPGIDQIISMYLHRTGSL